MPPAPAFKFLVSWNEKHEKSPKEPRGLFLKYEPNACAASSIRKIFFFLQKILRLSK